MRIDRKDVSVMSDTIKGTSGSAGKDKPLIVAIHQIMEESGWKGIETNFGVSSHNMVYIMSDSNLDKIEVKATVRGNYLDVNFLGFTPKKGFLDRVFDLNVQDVPKSFKISKYVSSDMNIQNEQILRNVIGVVLKQLENVATER
jgi:hypothetical protein